MHVGQFLELERPLECDRVTDVTTKEQHGRRIGETPTEFSHRIAVREYLFHQGRHRLQFTKFVRHLVGVLGTPGLGQRQADKVIRGKLGQKCLGCRHADLRPGAGVEDGIGLAWDLAAVGVADGQHLRLLRLGMPHRLQGVCSLAGL